MARTLSLITGDPDRGTEFAQEAFARAYPRWSRFATAEHARRWLFRTGINLSRSAWRKERRSLPAGLGPANPSPFVDASVEDRIAIRQALARVSPRQRACVALVDYLGFDTAEAARILRMPASTVRVHLSRGRRNLRPMLSEPEERS